MFLLKTRKCQNFFIASKNQGFTFIEALTVLFIFSVITLTFYSVFSLGSNLIIESKNRLGAVALANEKMEIVRNLQYDDIGIEGGIPSGNIIAEEDVFESRRAYHVKTFVQYVDDSFDDVLPADTTPNDYKHVKITVSWDGAGNAESSVSLISRFVPPGIEQSTSGGTLAINIIGSDGVGVAQSSVHITNSDVSPAVNTTVMTDDTGNIMFPGATQSIQGYYISVTKDGYENVEMIDQDSVAYSVIDTPASVIDGMLNVKSIVQDKLANIKIVAKDYTGVSLPNINFHIEGGRILGSDMLYSPAMPTYNLVNDETTDNNGKVHLDDISPGQFFISDIEVPAGHALIGLEEFSSMDLVNNRYVISVAPGYSKETNIIFAKNDDNSLLVTVVAEADDAPIFDAEVTLTNTIGYSETRKTLADGVAFFPLSATQLEVGTYDLQVKVDGFGDYSGSVDIDMLTTQEVKLVTN